MIWSLGSLGGGTTNHGEFDIMAPGGNGGSLISMYADNDNPSQGGMILDYLSARNFVSAATIQGNVKNFRVPHPDKPGYDIVYGCVEGPEIAMYVRGTAQLVGGSAVITLPEHFIALADQEGLTVQVTPLTKKSKGLAVTAKSLAGITVEELGDGDGSYAFDWEVKAVRKEHRDWQPVQPTGPFTPGPISNVNVAGK